MKITIEKVELTINVGKDPSIIMDPTKVKEILTETIEEYCQKLSEQILQSLGGLDKISA